MKSVEKNQNIIDKYQSNVITGGGLDKTIVDNVRTALTEQGIMNYAVIKIIYSMAQDGGYTTQADIIKILNILQSDNNNTYRGLYEKISGLLKTTISSNVFNHTSKRNGEFLNTTQMNPKFILYFLIS
jgi:DNA-binding MarR family transcriptional regulator